MVDTPTYKELQQRIAILERESEQNQRFGKINSTLFEISNAINTTSSLDEMYKTIHLALSSIIDTTNFYIASYDKVNDSVTFPYIVDTVDVYYPPVIGVSKTASLTAEVIKTGAPIMITKSDILAQRDKSSLVIPECTPAEIWLGVPLKHLGEIVGVMTVQNYNNPLCYDQTDMKVMVAVADQVALAIERKQVEKALQESEVRFHNLLQEIPSVAVQGYKLDGTTHFWNQASERLYGYTANEAIGRNLLDLIIPLASKGDVRQAMEGMASTGAHIPASELSLMRKDGSHVTVFSSHAIVEIPGREPELFCLDIDLTERKLAEDTLKDNLSFLHALIDTIPIPLFYKNLKGEYLGVNKAFEEFFKKSREYIIGKTAYDLSSKHIADKYYEKDQELLHSQGKQVYEWQVIDAAGVVRDVIFNKACYTDREGKITGIIGTISDITDRKKSEVALQVSEERYRRLTENAKDMIYRMSLPDGKYEYVSPAAENIFGYQPQVFYDFPLMIKEAIHPNWRDFFAKQWQLLLVGGMPQTYEYQIIHKSGEERWLNQRNVLVKNESGQPVAIEAIVTDITGRKKAEEETAKLEGELQQAHKMESIGNLAGGIAHEFNNMLAIIMGNNELIIEELPQGSLARESTDEIRIAGLRARDVVKQLLTFSRQDDAVKKTMDFKFAVEESMKLIRSSTPANINIEHNLSADTYPVMGNDTQINQLLINICNNAIDAMPEKGGVITIELLNETIDKHHTKHQTKLKSGQYAKLMVSDNGIGMESEILDRVFEPYFTTKDIGEGTGIGMAVVHGIVERHGGAIIVDSKPGQGTTFTIFLPAHEALFEQETGERDILPVGNECILYVDDEPSIAKLGKRLLDSLGYTTESITDPEEALALVRNDPYSFDLLITDMAMPNMTGDQLVIEALKIRQDMPTIICTGYSATISEKEAADIGARSYIMKPINKSELATTVRKVLDNVKMSNLVEP